MKSQNVLEQKQSKSKKIHPKTNNNKNFCLKKNLIHKKKRKKERKKENSRSVLSEKHQANPISLLISSQEEAGEAGDTNSSYMYPSLTGLRFCKTYEFPLCRVAS